MMLKHIALVKGNEALAHDMANTLDTNDLHVVLTDEQTLPPSTVGLVLIPEEIDKVANLSIQMARQFEELYMLLGIAVDAREQFAPGATQRTIEHATRFAEALGLDREERSRLERGAVVHDVGKLRIPNDVLLKKSVLTYDEWVLLQSHPKLGAEFIEQFDSLRDTREIIMSHHECYDGTGYPDAMEKDEIPRLAHVMKIIDVYCAMTSPRHYRQGCASHEEALAYFESEKGKHYDPDLVDLFIRDKVGKPLENPS